MRKVYKSGKVRLTQPEIGQLHWACWDRDEGRCQVCGKPTILDEDRTLWEGHPDLFHMGHIQSRGAGGSDTLENVRTLCGDCHRKEHQGKL